MKRILSDNYIIIFLFFFICFAIFPVSSEATELITKLEKNTFALNVYSGPGLWLVQFCLEWDTKCKSFAPEFRKTANKLKDTLRVGTVDFDAQPELSKYFKLRARELPALLLFPSDFVPSPSGKPNEYIKEPIYYTGPLTSNSIVKWVFSQLPNFVTKLYKGNIDQFLSAPPSKVVLFSDQEEVPPMYKGLAALYRWRLEFGHVFYTEQEVVKRFPVGSFPTLMVSERGLSIFYDGPFQYDPIRLFLDEFAPPAQKPKDASGPLPEKDEPKTPTKLRPGIIHLKNQRLLDDNCPKDDTGICLVFLLDPTDPVQHQKDLHLLRELSNKFRIFWVDAISKPRFVETFIDDESFDFPQLIVLVQKKKAYVRYMGKFNEKSISEWYNAVVSGGGNQVSLSRIPSLDPSFDTRKDEL